MSESKGSKPGIMVVFAHPDDADFTSGGAIARWVAEGQEVVYVVCTDGSKGTGPTEAESAALARTRREEQLAAARVLGVKDALFLDYPDGELEGAKEALRERLIRLIREYRPHRLVTWDPWRPYQLHRDHTAAGYAAFYAAVEASIPTQDGKNGSKVLPVHQVDELYLFGTEKADAWVDISDFAERKREAGSCHSAGRHHSALGAGACEHAASGRSELVPAVLAALVAGVSRRGVAKGAEIHL